MRTNVSSTLVISSLAFLVGSLCLVAFAGSEEKSPATQTYCPAQPVPSCPPLNSRTEGVFGNWKVDASNPFGGTPDGGFLVRGDLVRISDMSGSWLEPCACVAFPRALHESSGGGTSPVNDVQYIQLPVKQKDESGIAIAFSGTATLADEAAFHVVVQRAAKHEYAFGSYHYMPKTDGNSADSGGTWGGGN